MRSIMVAGQQVTIHRYRAGCAACGDECELLAEQVHDYWAAHYEPFILEGLVSMDALPTPEWLRLLNVGLR